MMNKRLRPRYTDKNSVQTLQEGLEEYYIINSDFTHPSTQPEDFAKILLAHDASHVIYGCDTDMYDELNFEPLLERSLLEIRQEFELLPFISDPLI
jgi:ubiquinone biosynthesis protein Coq4